VLQRQPVNLQPILSRLDGKNGSQPKVDLTLWTITPALQPGKTPEELLPLWRNP
jgi:hypothetical protein